MSQTRQLAAIMFTDIVGYTALMDNDVGPMVSAEIDGLKNIFNAPIAGFFTYGEIGRASNGKNEYHNTTCCLVALKEK
jgi:hypothetical protein